MWNNRELLKALRNDDEVKAAVISIVKEYSANQRKQQKIVLDERSNANTTENENFDIKKEETIEELNKKIQELEKVKEQLQGKVEESERQKVQIRQNAELQLTDKDKKIKDYKNDLEKKEIELGKLQKKYQKLDQIYQMYLSMSGVVHSRLKRVLNPGEQPCESAEVFLAYGVQEGNIIALWDVINLYATNNYGAEELESLLNIFDYFFKIFKAVSFKQVEGYQPQVGTEFDERYHTRTQDRHVSGRIKKVILPGFTIGQNITKKPLVYVE